jgi:hypothetical protein
MRRTLDIATDLDDARLQAYALFGVAVVLVHRDVGEATERLDQALACFRATQDGWGLALTLSTRGQFAQLAGDAASAKSLHEAGLAAADAIDNDHLRAQIRDMLGLDAVTTGDLAVAWDQYSHAAELHARMLDYEGTAYSLSGLAGLALAENRPEAAARLTGASSHARRIVGIAVWPGMQPITRAQTAAVAAALDPARFESASAEGARFALDDALHYGLAATAPDLASDPFPSWSARLRPTG